MVSSADTAGSVAVGVTFLADPVGMATEDMGAWVIEMMKIRVIGVVAPVGCFWPTRSLLSPVK